MKIPSAVAVAAMLMITSRRLTMIASINRICDWLENAIQNNSPPMAKDGNMSKNPIVPKEKLPMSAVPQVDFRVCMERLKASIGPTPSVTKIGTTK